MSSGATWTVGNVGPSALSVNGTAAGVATASGPVVDTSGSFTVSAWVNLATVSGFQTVVSIAGQNVAGFYLGLRSDTGAFSFARIPTDTTSPATVVAAGSAPAANTWYHIVGVDDASAGTLTLYVDGRSQGRAAFTSGWAATGDTLIGHGFYNGNQVDFVNGSIDDVQFFSSALSAAQVAALDQPAAYSFDDGSGSTAADITGHGNTLTLGGGASWTTGYIGSNAIALNGTSAGNAVTPAAVLNTAQSFSVSAWVNLNSLDSTQTFVSIDGTTVSAFALQYRTDTGQFAFTRLASDSTTAQSIHADGTTPTIGTWYHLVGVDDVATGQLLLYVNGVLQSSAPYATAWQASGATVIGGGLFNGGRTNFANATIDDVHFFNSPVTAGDVTLLATGGNSVITVSAASTGITVSPDLFGAFMEDINYGGEGGIYNDEVRNSGFNDSTNALNGWSAVTGSGAAASLASDTTTGPTSALAQSGALTITSGVSATARAGIANSGYFGVAIAPSTTYTVDFYAKATPGFTGPLTIDLESTTGTLWATATVTGLTSSWAEYSVTLTTADNAPITSSNLLVLSTNDPSANGQTIWFGATYLYPPSYQNQPNHLRIDLMNWLAQLHPAIFRVPGGNYLEGNTYDTRFNWSTTVGSVQDRPGHYNSAWGYWSTDGMGLDEYLQMAEESGASPILAVYAGYTLNGSSDTGATLTNDVTDAINELHYVLDPTTTAWGALRAANGHPAPYDVKYVEVGNEDFFSSTYATRYPLFYNAIRAEFPNLKIIATGSNTGGTPFDVLDEHFYNSASWFESNSHYYDNTARGSYQVFVGEYSAREGSPTNDMNAALGDASWLLGLERNSDLVTMSSYAPLWSNVNGSQWTPDLIGFNASSSYASPSYYGQLILSHNHGTHIVADTVSGATGLQTLVTRTGSTYYLTVINTGGSDNDATINLANIVSVSPDAMVTSLIGSARNATNSITNPDNIVPVTSTFTGLAPTFTYNFPGYSITVLQFNAQADIPTVSTPASASPVPVTGTTTNLSVAGDDPVSGQTSSLTYTWSAEGPAAVGFSVNGTTSANNTVATFSAAGSYNFTVTIANSLGATTTSSVSVNVVQTSTGFAVNPSSATVIPSGVVQFAAGEADQFGNLISAGGSIHWSILNGGGSITSSGAYVAPANAGTATIQASDDSGHSGTATITVTQPVAWYQANASSGNTLADSSGNNNSASLSGAYSFVPGVSGNALDLSGGYASLPAGVVSNLTDFTISAWINVSSLANWSRIFDFGSGTTTNMFLTPDAGGTNRLRFAITTSGGSGEQRLDGPAITPGVWTHVAVTLSGTTGTLYVDGTPVATNPNMTLNPASLGATPQNYLGKSQYNDPAFKGLIDDFRIYGFALSSQQVAELAEPTVIVPPAAAISPVTGTQVPLSVLAADVTAGEPSLTYTWSTIGTPPAPVTFSDNGTNAAKNTTATFTSAGTYTFQVTIINPAAGIATTSNVTVAVDQTLTSILLSPPSASLVAFQTQQFAATGVDQFGAALAVQPAFSWSVDPGGIGSVDDTGLYTPPGNGAPQLGGAATVRVSSGTVSATANVTVRVLMGDANGDGTVDGTDLSIVMAHMGQATSAWTSGNFTGDPRVNLSDISIVLNNMGSTLATAPASNSGASISPTGPVDSTSPTSETNTPAPTDSTTSGTGTTAGTGDSPVTDAPPAPVPAPTPAPVPTRGPSEGAPTPPQPSGDKADPPSVPAAPAAPPAPARPIVILGDAPWAPAPYLRVGTLFTGPAVGFKRRKHAVAPHRAAAHLHKKGAIHPSGRKRGK